MDLDEEDELSGGEQAFERFVKASVACAAEQMVIASSVSASEQRRQVAQRLALNSRLPFLDCYLRLPLDRVLAAAPDGLIAAGLCGEMEDVPGVALPFQQPLNPQLIIEGSVSSLAQQVEQVVSSLNESSFLLSQRSSSPRPLLPHMAGFDATMSATCLVAVLPVSEAFRDPALNASWACAFDGNDDALLVFYAPDSDPQQVIAELAPLIDAQGMSAPGTAKLLLLAGLRSDQVDQELAERADLLLGESSYLDLAPIKPAHNELQQLYRERQHG